MMNKYDIVQSSRFKKDYRLIRKRNHDITRLNDAIDILSRGEQLPPHYFDHPLKGDYKGCRECHITPDWLLIYKVIEDKLLIRLMRTGTHSDLF